MHERSVAADLVRAVGVTAFEEGGTVETMHIRMGSLSGIDPEALREQIHWHAQGTVAEGATVEVEVVPAEIDDEHGADIRLVSVELAR